ncbi:MAG: molecular chaperone SurA [SAR86 cluster bacterium]|uniref:Chaperone SurA n=1 Tax=SAR86 cluster bacterium TaxID=2030880 RepID=A0A2A5AVQ1_9GAMM|nr:MAG: molecular chaperone SurA [SAR86 cluster bacterium]
MNKSVAKPHSKARLTSLIPVICLGMCVLAAAPFVSAQRVLLDKIVVVVDSDVVLQSELESRMTEIRANAARANQSIPEEDELREEVLDVLIIENLQMQFAERVSIRFDDDSLNRVLNSMATNSNMSFDEYITALEDNGVYLQTREQIRQQMTMQELQRGMVNRRITITEQEIENFLNSETGREVMSADYLLDHLLIPTSSDETAEVKASKLKYAADLLAQIEEGTALGVVRFSAQQSNSDFPVEAIEFGWRKAEQLPDLFSDIVVDMSIGDIEGPIEAGNGFHVIQLADKRGGTDQMVEQTNIRHILLTPNEIRTDEQSLDAILELRQRIIDGENFASLARQNSDDASSVVGGGDLDWVSQGYMPLEMELVVDELDINELSEPFRSESGWHIAEVMDRRVSDLSLEYSRSQAENALRNRKFDLELQNWLIEIREEAFVEFVD